MRLKVDDISYLYEADTAMQVTALDHISVEIPENQFIGLIGHTGSGKSTFVQTLNGLLKVSSGHIYYDGQDIDGSDFDKKVLRANVGLVFQYPEHQLFETDVMADVMFGPRNLGLSESECKDRALKALRQVGLPEKFYKQSPFELSGGQKRRAAIAGVLAMDPKVLILDEPTAGLDPRGRDRILTMLEELRAREHTTILMVSHSMEDMARLASRLLVIYEGKLAADGSPRELFSRPGLMSSVGLDIPEAARLCAVLRARGYDLPADLYRPEELREHLLRLWKEASAC